MTKPIFSTKKKIKDYNEGDIQVRIQINKKIWFAFRAIVVMKNTTVHNSINDILKKWIDDSMLNIKYYCTKCKKKVEPKNSFIAVEDGMYYYYCSVDCFVTSSQDKA